MSACFSIVHRIVDVDQAEWGRGIDSMWVSGLKIMPLPCNSIPIAIIT